MYRLDVINSLIKQRGLKNYLEIGVENGHIFFRIPSTFKVAVDPKFIFDISRRIGKTFTNPTNIFNQYYEKTSDDFFEQDAKRVFADKSIQIALIDGMHEYEFALRDVENTLHYLENDGVIIMHDCNPQSKQAGGSFSEWKEGIWNGDVWKTVLHLRSLRDDLTVFVLDCDHGLGIVTKGKPINKLNLTPDQIKKFSYEDLEANREKWLNLKPANYFYEYFNLKK